MSGSVTFTLREDELAMAARRNPTRARGWLQIGIILATLALGLMLLARGFGLIRYDMTPVAAALILVILGLVLAQALLRVGHVKMAKQAYQARTALRDPMTLDWDARAIAVTTSGSRQESPVGALVKYGVWPDLVLLYPGETNYIAVPVRAFSGEQLNDLTHILSAAGVRRIGRPA